VDAVDGLHGKSLEQAVVDHRLGPGLAFLGRLEDQHDGSRKPPSLGQIARRAQQHGGMAVVAAGVHGVGVDRAIGPVGQFLDRQGVHVCAQADAIAGAVAQDADHAGLPDSFDHLIDAEATQQVGHRPRRAMLGIGQFGMLVNVAPPCRHGVVKRGDAGNDRHGRGVHSLVLRGRE